MTLPPQHGDDFHDRPEVDLTKPPAPGGAQSPYGPPGPQFPGSPTFGQPGQLPGYNPYAQPGYPQPYGQPPFPGYGNGPVHAPFGVDPATGLPYSDKSKTTAGVLQLVLSLFGLPGIGRLYMGDTTIGLLQLIGAIVSLVLVCFFIGIFTLLGLVIWGVVDGIILLTSSSPRDSMGRVLRS